MRKKALALYKPPFRYEGGYIFDADSHMVADQVANSLRVRGWGRISYMKDSKELQDEVGKLIAEAMTQFWTENAA